MQHLCFDIIYENDCQNGENNYRVDPFLVKMQLDEIKCRFTEMISSVVVLPVLLSLLFCILYVFTGIDTLSYGLSFHFCKRLIFIPRRNKDFTYLRLTHHSFIQQLDWYSCIFVREWMHQLSFQRQCFVPSKLDWLRIKRISQLNATDSTVPENRYQ